MSEQSNEVAQVGDRSKVLRAYAEHFAPRDWDWTRSTKIKRIRYEDDFSGYDHPAKRVRRWLDDYNPFRKRNTWVRQARWRIAWRHPLVHVRVSLGTDRHLPDGVLDGGGVIAFWEETGEYLQMVQPSVGSLVADIMDAHPDLPEVQALAAELQRIADRYHDRLGGQSDD